MPSSSSSAYRVRAVLSAIVRLICVAFVVAAGLAIPHAWSLSEQQQYELRGSTLYVPLQICEPPYIALLSSGGGDDGSNETIVFLSGGNVTTTETTASNASDAAAATTTTPTPVCHALEHLINACVLAIIFAMAATVVFFVFDALSYCKKIRVGAVLGMSVMLVFILVMAAACCYALYEEMDSWEEYFQRQLLEEGNEYGIRDVQTHGEKNVLAWAFLLALIAAGALLLDALVVFCCGENVKPRTTNGGVSKPEAPAALPAANSEQPAAASDAGPSAEPETPPPPADDDEPTAGSGRPAWTNV